MLAGHRQEHARDLRILTDVLVYRLSNKVPERYIVFRFATDFTGVTPEAPARIDEPAVFLAVIRRFDALSPELFRLKLSLARITFIGETVVRSYDWQRGQPSGFLDELAAVVWSV